MTLAEAKQRLRIQDIWRRFDLPGMPKQSCRCPFRKDKHPSFSVSADGMLFHDFVEGRGGDAVDFLRQVTGLSHGEACRKFIELAGGTSGRGLPSVRLAIRPETQGEREKPSLPPLRRGTAEEFEKLATLRNVSPGACAWADACGVLRFSQWKGHSAWVVTDNEGVNAQARRMDGELWEGIAAKAQTLPGSWATWPLGARIAQHYPFLLMCEGGPDLLAAFHFIMAEGREVDCFPVAMLGAAQSIHPSALQILARKRVRIYAHADVAGRKAAERWASQLVECEVDITDFSGLRKTNEEPINDLNDCTSIHPDEADELEGVLPL